MYYYEKLHIYKKDFKLMNTESLVTHKKKHIFHFF